MLSWSAGPKRGEVTRSMAGSFHVSMVQEAETHYHEQQSHIHQSAGQFVLFHKNTVETGV